MASCIADTWTRCVAVVALWLWVLHYMHREHVCLHAAASPLSRPSSLAVCLGAGAAPIATVNKSDARLLCPCRVSHAPHVPSSTCLLALCCCDVCVRLPACGVARRRTT